jgi:GT2 family glycosyltransferase
MRRSGPVRRAGEDTEVTDKPSVAIVIANWNGASHLPDCLNSLEQLDYPRERYEVIVVDNGSTDGSIGLLEQRYPWVRVVANPVNLGFAAASNIGAEAATADCVAFLNNDMRADSRWLAALVESYAPESGYVCIAGAILSWDGTQIDFVDGRINFHGAPEAEYRDHPLEESLIEDGRDLPFPCGGSMLISRDLFLELGGFDPDYFAYCEDVDLGWRLWVCGYKVRLAAGSRCFHRRHGTGSSIPLHTRIVLYERNNLTSLIKNVSDENLAPLVAAALFLLIERSVVLGGFDRDALEIGSNDLRDSEEVGRMGLAGLHATSGVLANLDQVLEKRQDVQRRRRRSDAEVFELFRRPFVPVMKSESYLRASVALRGILDLDRLFRHQRASRILIVAGADSPRLRTLAQGAASLTDVVFASEARTPTLAGVSVTPIRSASYLGQLVLEADIVIVEGDSLYGHVIAQQASGLVVVDMPDEPRAVQGVLLQRADVLVRLAADQGPRDTGALEVVAPDDGSLLTQIRSLIAEPWHWRQRRDGAVEIVLPEDLRLLLAQRRGSVRNGVVGAAHRALWSRLPEGLQRVFLRVMRARRT